MLGYKQIQLLYQNAPSITVEKYTTKNDFLLFFLTHLTSFFQENGKTFQVLEPLFEGDNDISQVTTISVNGEEFGKFYYLLNDHNEDITFFFYSEIFSHKFFLMEDEPFQNIPIHTYWFWLKSLFGIFESYEEDLEKRKR